MGPLPTSVSEDTDPLVVVAHLACKSSIDGGRMAIYLTNESPDVYLRVFPGKMFSSQHYDVSTILYCIMFTFPVHVSFTPEDHPAQRKSLGSMYLFLSWQRS